MLLAPICGFRCTAWVPKGRLLRLENITLPGEVLEEYVVVRCGGVGRITHAGDVGTLEF